MNIIEVVGNMLLTLSIFGGIIIFGVANLNYLPETKEEDIS